MGAGFKVILVRNMTHVWILAKKWPHSKGNGLGPNLDNPSALLDAASFWECLENPSPEFYYIKRSKQE